MSDENYVTADHLVPQDLHMHSVYSKTDSSVVPKQTISLIAGFRHAVIQGISDHLECFETDDEFEKYAAEVRENDFLLGIEVNGFDRTQEALRRDVDYFVYHCRDLTRDYEGAGILVDSGKPVIIAHPCVLETRLSRVPDECYIEINNRYVWRSDWKQFYSPFIESKRFVFGSDAHQPNWLNQNIARKVGEDLGVHESILFPDLIISDSSRFVQLAGTSMKIRKL